MWGGLGAGADTGRRPNMLRALSALGALNKSSYSQDMGFLAAVLWPVMRREGVRQHDAFSCGR